MVTPRSGARAASLSALAPIMMLGALMPAAASAQETACTGILPDEVAGQQAPRSIMAEDLVRLRDIGAQRPHDEPVTSLSPDGLRAAFVLVRADPASNTACNALVTIGLKSGEKPRLLDTGGEPIFEPIDNRGVETGYGYPAANVPLWSPDGQWVAYLKREKGVTRIWRVRSDGTRAGEPMSRSTVDVDRFAWTEGGTALIVARRPDLAAGRVAIRDGGAAGFLYDSSFVPNAQNRPSVRLPLPYEFVAIDVATGIERPATPSERQRAMADPGADPSRLHLTVSAQGRTAWFEPTDKALLLSPVALHAEGKDGRFKHCLDPACNLTSTDILGLWWSATGEDLIFLRRQGWNGGDVGLYRWSPEQKAPRRLLVTGDLLLGCIPAGDQLLCGHEASRTPRQLTLIDLNSGRSRLLFDPNPDFATLRLGTVERLRWRNDLGFEVYGDLVLPPDYRPGHPLPLIVVQYHSRGFLRGGTGDELPIHLFADRGYAVLSFQRPLFYFSRSPGRRWASQLDMQIENSRDWNERRSLLSALLNGVDLLIARGIADPSKLGISGVSDGSTTTQFALVNRPGLFAAASVAACCVEPTSMMAFGGLALAQDRRSKGYPAFGPGDEAFWQPLSLARNAHRITTPLLLQLADNEYLLGVETFTALHDQGQPVEMHIFPDEYHLKWQPAHRLSVYKRNLDWFDYWLLGREDADPAKRAQYDRWGALRQSRQP